LPLRNKTYIHKGVISALNYVESVSHISYIAFEGRWCDVIVLNAYIPAEERNKGKHGSVVR